MKKRSVACLLLMALTVKAWGQSYQKTDVGVKAFVDGMSVEVSFYSPATVRVLKYPGKDKPSVKSYAVVARPQPVKWEDFEMNGLLKLESEALNVYLDLKTGRVIYADKTGSWLLSEKDHGTQFTPVEYAGQPDYLVRQAFRLEGDAAVYGLGQHQQGGMNQRNRRVRLEQHNTEIAIPFFQSVRGYGVYWDNVSPTTFTDNVQETAFDSQSGSCADYYFMYGGTADGVIAQMRQLTGGVQMNALWTYGYWQSKERYKSQDELLDVVRKYRALQVPLDGIVQDWQYWGVDSKDWNALTFGNPLFSDPKGMIDEVHRQNAHIIISVWPSFGTNTEIYKELKQRDMILDFTTYPSAAGVYDVFNPEARALYWERMNRDIFALGMDGWWLDATEPENKSGDEKKDQMTHDGLYRSVYNAFPIVSVGGVHDNQRATTSDKRVFILTRSAYAGQQRYGACSWSGDIRASWNVLHKQIAAGVNFSACGIPYWNTDIGGFTIGDYPAGVKDVGFHELYVRWLQFGAFTPMMRSHGTYTPREIFNFGERGSWAFDAIEKYIRLRYKLLPYLYSTAWDVANGGTFMRGLFMDFPTDNKALAIDDEYLFGRSLLVAPVTEPMYTDRQNHVDMDKTGRRRVYLPAGTAWHDFWTGQRLQGGQTIDRAVPVDVMPLYVKAGSIIPFGPDVQYATQRKWDDLEIRVYPGADGEFVLYEDENDNYNYERGQYAVIPFTWDDARRELTIGARKGEFPGMLKNRRFRVVVVDERHGTGDAVVPDAGRKVVYKGRQVKVKL